MSKTYKCPFCSFKYVNKLALYNHMENKHKDQLGKLSAAQVYFNYKNKKTGGTCIICKKPTKWNPKTERYERLCSDACKKKYRELFKQRMKNAGKEHIMEDPEHQKKMLEARKISGTYKFKDGTGIKYVGSYEKDFLNYCEYYLGLSSKDIMGPAPQVFQYTYQGKKHFHIPDFYIPSMNLVIQIKSAENKHYRARDIEIEKITDSLVKNSSYNYFKIYDKNYTEFEKYFRDFDFVDKNIQKK